METNEFISYELYDHQSGEPYFIGVITIKTDSLYLIPKLRNLGIYEYTVGQ